MKPIAVFQHSPQVEPGHFASFLTRRKLPWRHSQPPSATGTGQDDIATRDSTGA